MQCLCENWLLFEFSVMVCNLSHLAVQMWYFVHFNNFDPQQNQIDCVQSYTFFGDNLLLFLTSPAVCFIALVESLVLSFSWAAVIIGPGLRCAGDVNFSLQYSQFLFFL